MKVTKKEDSARKVCFARAGQVIQLLDAMLRPVGPYYLVYRLGKAKMQPSAAVASNGLYSTDDAHGLIDLATGIVADMPHLSSRMMVIHDAELVVKPVPTLLTGSRATLWHEGTQKLYEAEIVGPAIVDPNF